MPELPEVHTTVQGLNEVLHGLSITDVWSGYKSAAHAGKDNIKNPLYFKKFRAAVVGAKFVSATRRGKNVLVHVRAKGGSAKSSGASDNTILIHMKMTGHLLYGRYEFSRSHNIWRTKDTGPLQDPFNQHIRLVFTLSNGKHLAFSDLRKFAKVFVTPTAGLDHTPDLAHLGPDPLSRDFTLALFKKRLAVRPRGKIKQMLMEQDEVAGIGNIYSDEILYESGVHPLSIVGKIPVAKLAKMHAAAKLMLKRGIDFGGDSDSDYRNVYGEPGKFQHKHSVYRRTGKPCPKKVGASRNGRACGGIIERLKIGGRSAHFCPIHQTLFS